MSNIDKYVQEERQRVKDKKPFNSCHEAYAIMLEEEHELWDEVKKRKEKRNIENMKKELAQIIVCAERFFYFLESNEN